MDEKALIGRRGFLKILGAAAGAAAVATTIPAVLTKPEPAYIGQIGGLRIVEDKRAPVTRHDENEKLYGRGTFSERGIQVAQFDVKSLVDLERHCRKNLRIKPIPDKGYILMLPPEQYRRAQCLLSQG